VNAVASVFSEYSVSSKNSSRKYSDWKIVFNNRTIDDWVFRHQKFLAVESYLLMGVADKRRFNFK